MKKSLGYAIILLSLAACGIKPGSVEPPDAVKNKEFPRTYPNLQTQPPPFVPPGH